MSGKLLIVGDSFCTYYIEENRKHRNSGKNKPYIFEIKPFKYWFEYLGKELNLEIVNYAECGSGNQQIFDNTLYALNKHSDIKFAVVCWSGFDRIDLPRFDELYCTHINLTDTLEFVHNDISKTYNPLFRRDEVFNVKSMINKFINYSITLDSLFKCKDIKLLQAFSIEPYLKGSNEDRLEEGEVYRYYINHRFFDKINEKQFFEFPGTKVLGGKNLYQLLGEYNHKDWKNNVINPMIDDKTDFIVDNHPNAKGNKIIFDALYRFILDKY